MAPSRERRPKIGLKTLRDTSSWINFHPDQDIHNLAEFSEGAGDKINKTYENNEVGSFGQKPSGILCSANAPGTLVVTRYMVKNLSHDNK